jgi:predicted component of type VI protein secretion system
MQKHVKIFMRFMAYIDLSHANTIKYSEREMHIALLIICLGDFLLSLVVRKVANKCCSQLEFA